MRSWIVQLFLLIAVASGPALAADPDMTREIVAHAERMCLAEALYFEAGEEGEEGMRAVAEVIFRRHDEGYGRSICRVVYQGEFKKVCQFSFACDGARRRPRGSVLWKQAWRLAGEFIAGRKAVMEKNTTQGATYFHAVTVSPGWEKKGLVRTVQIGNHVFYRDRLPTDPPYVEPPAPAQ
ncbi:MAG: cell wall hydrolase [Alphaproteobacteria bacterium]|nr:cell wall hydrolase [Alphaproteobacteria bacterium]